MKLAPLSRENDGFCDIVKMKAQSGKLNLAKLLLNDSGDYFTKTGEIKPNSGVEYIKTKCWRLVPRVNLESSDSDLSSFNTYYSIDGERYPIEPIQVRTLPKALRVFCFNSPSN